MGVISRGTFVERLAVCVLLAPGCAQLSKGGVASARSSEIDAAADAQQSGSEGSVGHTGVSPQDGGTPEETREAASGVIFDATDRVDDGAPPSDCVAPCVWESIRDCVPDMLDCTAEEILDTRTTYACDLETGWSVVEVDMGRGGITTEFRRDGVTCLRVRRSVPISWVGDVLLLSAEGAEHVYCDGDPSAALNGEAPDYIVDSSQPRCAAWDYLYGLASFECKATGPGQCPH